MTKILTAYQDFLDSLEGQNPDYQRHCARRLLRAGVHAHWAGDNSLLAREIAFIASLVLVAGEDGIERFRDLVRDRAFDYAQCLADFISANVEQYNDFVYLAEDLIANANLADQNLSTKQYEMC